MSKITEDIDLLGRLDGGVTLKVVSTAVNINAEADQLISCDTSGGPLATGVTKFTIVLPASPTDGDIIQATDSFGDAQNSPITVSRNGKSINNLAEDLILDVNFFDVKLIYKNNNWAISGL